jgi:arginase family enzyme
MELELYFEIPEGIKLKKTGRNTISDAITYYNPKLIKKLHDFPVALIGIKDERNSTNTGVSKSPDIIRKYLYSLYNHHSSCKILDLGNIRSGKTLDDTYQALSDIVAFLLQHAIIPVIFGSSQDMMYPIAKAIKETIANPTIACIDSRLDVGLKNELHNHSTLKFIDSKIVPHKIIVIGSQTYLVSTDESDYIEHEKHTNYRLGKIREDFKKTEPLLRDSHFTVFDLSATRQCDAPGNNFTSPNGLTGEESCQLAKYAGLSEKTKAFFVCEYNPIPDINEQTAHLSAQLLWHFIDGFYNRKNDYPNESIENLQKYVLNSDDFGVNFIFYKSTRTDRWWIEITNDIDRSLSFLTPCNYEDYVLACQNLVPDIYLQEKSRRNKHNSIIK